ncbi:Asp-tRNA(Asn)/Glu-tRNA(Gln) amidotransferase subunit GatA [Patescibacteria group bacterium]|nr:Asp-tRNA(Asn)/Glu-tRNA(Gln) amidotransferase subunit GatA [Patescibacteria group bacterium]
MNNKLTLTEAKKLLQEGRVKSEELVSDCLDAIKKYDGKLNAFITVNEDALARAKKACKPNKNLPLSGIPYAIKDNFLTKGLRTTASSKVLDDYIPQYTATVVNKLEEAGAILLGKTNMDAWAHGSSTETSDYGATRNPWNFDYLPGGSSGGSAAAVIADMCTVAVGSETAGSIRQPAAWSGCVGLKPTYGRVSRYGVIAMGSSLDSPGPMTKSVEDAAILLEVLAGKDPYDATTSSKPVEKYSSYVKKGVKGLKIGIAREYLLPQMRSEVKDLIKDAGKVFQKLGAKVDYVSTLNPDYAIGVYTVIQRSEVSSNLARYDGIRYGNGRSYFGQEAKRRVTLGTFALSAGYAEKYYKKAQKVRTLYIRDFEKIFKKYDLVIGPTSPGHAQKLGAIKGQAMFGEMEDILVEPSTISGLPGINVPCGFVDGLPIGLDIFGPQFSEGKILQAASAYEQSVEWHEMKPTLNNYND